MDFFSFYLRIGAIIYIEKIHKKRGRKLVPTANESTHVMRVKTIHDKNKLLFDVLPQHIIVSCVEEAFDKLNQTSFGHISISDASFPSQIFCSIFHELIVYLIAENKGWKAGKQGKEADLVHESGLSLQIKTNSSVDSIAGNRHSSKNKYSDPSEYYLCVNFIPNDCICKIRAGWVNYNSWKPQKGKGNAAVLKKEMLRDMPLLYGEYLKEMNLISVEGIGDKSLESLQNIGISKMKDLFYVKNYVLAKTILQERSINIIDDILLHIS